MTQGRKDRGESQMLKLATAMGWALCTGSATADTVPMEFDPVGSGQNVRVSLSLNTINCFAGQPVHTFANGTGAAAGLNGNHDSFCSDFTQLVTSSGATGTATGIVHSPEGSPMGSARMLAIYDNDAAAGQGKLGSDAGATFRIAIWEVIDDNPANGSSLNLASGHLKARNADGTALIGSIPAKAGFPFSSIGSNAKQIGLLGFQNSSFQDQVLQVQFVPVPLAAVAGFLGLGMAGYLRRRVARS